MEDTFPWTAFDAVLEEIERRGKVLCGQISHQIEVREDDIVIVFRDVWSGRYVGQVFYRVGDVDFIQYVDDTTEIIFRGGYDYAVVGGFDRLTLRGTLRRGVKSTELRGGSP